MSDSEQLAALLDAIEGQNLYHGRHGTTPAGHATAMAIEAGLRSRGYVLTAARVSGDRPDARAIVETLGFDPTNHHNAAKCPYCTPAARVSGDREDGLDVELLAKALHGTGFDPHAEPWTWGSCLNWSPGWGDECGPEKHMDEARGLLRRLAAARLQAKDPA